MMYSRRPSCYLVANRQNKAQLKIDFVFVTYFFKFSSRYHYVLCDSRVLCRF